METFYLCISNRNDMTCKTHINGSLRKRDALCGAMFKYVDTSIEEFTFEDGVYFIGNAKAEMSGVCKRCLGIFNRNQPISKIESEIDFEIKKRDYISRDGYSYLQEAYVETKFKKGSFRLTYSTSKKVDIIKIAKIRLSNLLENPPYEFKRWIEKQK